MAHHAIELTLVFTLTYGLALVVIMLTLAERNLELGKPFLVDEKRERDDGLAGILHCVLELTELTLGKKELAVSPYFMVLPRAELIGRDMHLLDPELTAVEDAVGVGQRSTRLADRLDLSAIEHDTGRIAVDYLVVERGTLVADIYVGFGKHELFYN